MYDTHCHIDLYDDPASVATEVERVKILTIAVTNLPSAYIDALPYVRHYPHLRLALGLHPLLAKNHTPREKRLFKEAFSKAYYIGEVGLDFSREGISTKETQVESFRFVLSLISKDKRIITLHTRRAESMVLSLLDEYDVSPAIFHWYSGSPSLIPKIVERGHYFSINPSMASGTSSGQAIIARIPRDRLLTETDGPFVQVSNRPAIPSDVQKVHQYLSSTWSLSAAAVNEQLEANLHQLFESVHLPII